MRRAWGLVVVAAMLAVAGCGSSGAGGEPSGLNHGGGTGVIAAICSNMANLPCAGNQSVADCEAEGNAARAEAAQMGCGGEFDAYAACFAAHPPTGCDADGDLVIDTDACHGEIVAYGECRYPSETPGTG